MRLPVIKDGVVINVVEMDADTLCVDKATHQQMLADEDDGHRAALALWGADISERHAAIQQAKRNLFMASGFASAVKNQVREGKISGDGALTSVLTADAEVEAWQAKIADMKAQPLPERPILVRGRRWICPEGCILGPEGGQKGDIWTGEAYVRPAHEEDAA
ncbi:MULTISPECIES: hypothetical protein [Rhodomicrobium]|uniref:hypothetical protein n=1 Tax=Rhodomicrobium TaxID=1068 RepID=UPI000B4B2E27|nr:MULTISPECIES: hypothetical protein [Rhodomicrobium]